MEQRAQHAQPAVETSETQPDVQGERRAIGLLDRVAWRDAAIVWLLQRLALATLTYLVRWRIVPRPPNAPYPTGSELLHVWTNWDSAIYATIAKSGYTHLTQAAFFPLFPLLERLLMPLTGGNAALAGLLIANIACFGAFALLRILVEREYGRTVARRTLLYLVLFPYSLFLAAAYAESLFLLLSVATFLALRERRWWLAGLLAALATLTRPVGILLLLPLALELIRKPHPQPPLLVGEGPRTNDSRLSEPGECLAPLSRARVRGWGWGTFALLLPILALVGFNLALAPRFGTLTATTMAQQSGWGRHLSWPWDGLLSAASALPSGAPVLRFTVVLDIGWTLLFVVLALATLRWLPLPYALYACATAALVLLTPMHKPGLPWAALASNGRFLLVVFPIFMLLARWSDGRRWLHLLIVALSLLLSVLLALAFILGAFVA